MFSVQGGMRRGWEPTAGLGVPDRTSASDACERANVSVQGGMGGAGWGGDHGGVGVPARASASDACERANVQHARRGRPLPVEWVRIEDPDPDVTSIADTRSTFNQGWAAGGAKFNRLEGCWEDDGTIFFVSTSGGDAKNGDVNSDGYAEGFGQVWAYRPGRGRRDGGPSRSSTSRPPAPRATGRTT